MPFGEEITPDGTHRTANLKYNFGDNIRQKFTGYQKDEETQLDFAEARMYQNLHGRFTAVDPLLASGKSANPQTFNRYVYVMNNPLIYTDPTGLQAGNYTGSVYYKILEDGRWAFSNKSGKGYDTRYTGGARRITAIDGYQYTVSSRGWRQHGLDVVAARGRSESTPQSPKSQDAINTALLKDLGMRAPATQQFLFLLMASGAAGGAGAATAVGTGGVVFVSTVVGEALLAEQGVRQLGEAQRESLMMGSIDSDRRYAVDQAWKREAELVRETGEGSREWTADQKKELLETGRVKGYQGHHINSVNGNPEQARNPQNVEFVTRDEHFERHMRNWRNQTRGPLRPR